MPAPTNAGEDDAVLVGHPFAPIGMGEHVRSVWRAFAAAGMDAKVFDIFKLCDRSDADFARVFVEAEAQQLSRRLNVFHINGDEVAQTLAHISAGKPPPGARNIVYPAWELSRYPKPWADELDRFDEIWAPSEFVREAIAASARKPVVRMPLAVDAHMSSFLTRRALGLPESAFIFLFFFDFTSYAARKNPVAVLNAFDALVKRHPKAPFHLVLKHKGGKASPKLESELNQALERNGGQIQIIDRQMSDNEVKNLVRAADCFVSLHRSEGFGRGLAEAMALGVPTVGTGYSGNMEFMSAANSWLVDYDLVAVEEGEYPHPEGQVWAEPRQQSAVDALERVWLDRSEAREKAARARRDIAHLFSPLAIGLRYLEQLAKAGAQ